MGSAIVHVALGVLLSGSLTAATVNAEPVLDVGDVAPDFVLQGSDGKQYGRDELVAGGGVIIAWFPRAFTPG